MELVGWRETDIFEQQALVVCPSRSWKKVKRKGGAMALYVVVLSGCFCTNNALQKFNLYYPIHPMNSLWLYSWIFVSSYVCMYIYTHTYVKAILIDGFVLESRGMDEYICPCLAPWMPTTKALLKVLIRILLNWHHGSHAGTFNSQILSCYFSMYTYTYTFMYNISLFSQVRFTSNFLLYVCICIVYSFEFEILKSVTC